MVAVGLTAHGADGGTEGQLSGSDGNRAFCNCVAGRMCGMRQPIWTQEEHKTGALTLGTGSRRATSLKENNTSLLSSSLVLFHVKKTLIIDCSHMLLM